MLLSSGLPLSLPLADALTQRSFRECLVPSGTPLPRSPEDFAKLLESRRGALSEVAEEVAAIILTVLKELRAARAALSRLAPAPFADAIADVNAQLQTLLPPTFIESTPRPWLDYLPRYLKAITRRVERLAGNLKRDAELAAKVKPFAAALRALHTQAMTPSVEQLRWMVEEFRVSLFAQELRAMIKVSEKRLDEQVELARKEASS